MADILQSFEPAAGMPNSPLPLIFAEAAIQGPGDPDAVKALLRRHGWQGTWLYTIYDFWHYHTTGHEVLACVAGEAEVGFGGDTGLRRPMRPGDAVIIPAGVGHRRFSASRDFAVVGAYPPGQDGTVVRAGEKPLDAAAAEIATLALPDYDPIDGRRPGRLAAWSSRGGPRR